jgi:hypothetical protein
MKTPNRIIRMFKGSRLVLAVVVIATGAATGAANAQYKPTGDDGITASPKLRQQLDERRARLAAVAVLPSMSCPKCQDTWVTQADTRSKGSGSRALMGQTAQRVAKHLCDGCGMDWKVAGTGKGKHEVATHKCSGCGAKDLACCSTKGSSEVATKGMGEKVQVAPLK